MYFRCQHMFLLKTFYVLKNSFLTSGQGAASEKEEMGYI